MTIKYIPLLAMGIIISSCGNKQNKVQGPPQAQPFPVVEIAQRDITGTSVYPVRIEGIVNSEVRAKISGYITEVLVDEGQRVSRGQALFRLETHSLSEEAEAAKANVEAAQVGVDQLRPLVEQNIVSRVQLETAQAKLAQAKAAYKSITANIGYANITSPIEGYVGSIAYRNGSLVSPTSPLPLTTVSNTNEVFCYFAMNEADYVDFLQKTPGKTLNEKISHFPPVHLKLANGETYEHEGKIQTVTAQVNPTTGTVSFRATFPNPEHLIANGSSGNIIIPRTHSNAVLVPEESTFEQQGKVYVYKVEDDNTVTAKVIEVYDKVGSILIASDGIKPGEKIVAKGIGKLRDSQEIVPTAMSFDSLTTPLTPAFQ